MSIEHVDPSAPVRASRRTVLAGLAATATTAAQTCWPLPAQAQATPHRLKLGAITITVFSDGALSLPIPVMLPATPAADVAALLTAAGQPPDALVNQMNIALVDTGAERILIDAGAGPEFLPGVGKLERALAAAGFAPDSITKVVFTHAHPDHLWGAIDPLTGDTMFEKAAHLMTIVERDTWLQPDIEARSRDPFKGMAAGSHRRMKILAPRIQAIEPGAEIAPGLLAIDTAGHTPGHISVLVRSGGEQVLIGSDVLVQPVISFAAPQWRWGPDMDSDQAVAARRRTLDQLVTDKIRLLGYHLPWPGLGAVERKDNAYRFAVA
jgi:glyoxylase-like metal-dependent hydrolase (beta-lactamase superfamily II)